MTSTRDIAWLAGILDGEGCILARLANRANATGGNIAVEVRVEVTSRAMTSKMQKVLSDLGVQFGVCESRPKLATKEVFRTCVSNKKDVQVLLKAVLPDLSTKRPEAELALAWYERWPDQRGTGTLRATYEEKLAFKAALAALKRTA